MKEKDVIQKLTRLKQISASQNDVFEMKRRINHQIMNENDLIFGESFGDIFRHLKFIHFFLFAGFALGVLLIIFAFNTNIIGSVYILKTKVEIALTNNQLNRVNIAISNTEIFIDRIKSSKKLSRIDTSNISQSLAMASNELSKLKLKGEKGKYTMIQCLQSYEKFHNDLEDLEKNIQNNSKFSQNQENLNQLKYQMQSYDRLSEIKLKLYKKPL